MWYRLVLVLALSVGAAASAHGASSAREMYITALARERHARAASDRKPATADQIRAVIAAYEKVVRRYPASGYADNALWQAAGLAIEAFDRFGDERDRARARRLLEALASQYPASSLAARATARARDLDGAAPAPALATLRSIHRTPLGNGVRVTLELDAEVSFQSERLDDPQRLFFDLAGTQAAPALLEPALSRADDLVRQIRLGKRPDNTMRVVLDLDRAGRHSVFALYNPFRVVIDFERAEARLKPGSTSKDAAEARLKPGSTSEDAAEARLKPDSTPDSTAVDPAPLAARAAAPPSAASPKAPASNSLGGFSLARQLGLGVARVVIDPGHGGHDPGARANRLAEAELVLDVALRVEKLLLKHPGIEVVLTRRTDLFIPLEERTAIANREGADLFLSIHGNASRSTRARGVETYFLNFASNPEAEAVAARENAASGRTMRNLPDILKAIALNTKLDESRDFAAIVQKSMIARLRAQNRQLRDLGVKQAPFVVLIGAEMPSVLAEISFVTNRAEGQLLRAGNYRQRIAEALTEAILRYQRSLKAVGTVAGGR